MAELMNKRELASMVRNMKPNEVVSHIQESLKSRDLTPDDFSIRDLFEATVSDGRELLEAFRPGSGSIVALEEAGSVDSSLFKNISGQLIFSKVMEAYQSPVFIGDKLAQTIPTIFDGEKIPGITQIGDQAGVVKEGKDYPRAGVSEDWVETPQTAKRGMIVEVTKEAVYFDRTGILLRNAGAVGEWLAVNKEKRIIDLAIGVTTNWNPQGKGALSTYSNSTGLHSFDNLANSNSLATYADINDAQDLLEAITDPWTGEPVIIAAPQILCTNAIARVARSIINATQVKQDPNSNAGTAMTVNYIPPAALIGQNIEIISNPYVASRMTAGSVTATNWYFGDFRKAFGYMENWSMKVEKAPANNDDEFNRDIVAKFKVSERGVPAVLEPRYVVLNAAS